MKTALGVRRPWRQGQIKAAMAALTLLVVAALAATPALAAPAFKVAPRTLGFGKASPGATKTFTVTSISGGILLVTASSSSPSFSVSPSQGVIGSGQPQTFTVTFTPTKKGPQSGKITVSGGNTNIKVTARGNSSS